MKTSLKPLLLVLLLTLPAGGTAYANATGELITTFAPTLLPIALIALPTYMTYKPPGSSKQKNEILVAAKNDAQEFLATDGSYGVTPALQNAFNQMDADPSQSDLEKAEFIVGAAYQIENQSSFKE